MICMNEKSTIQHRNQEAITNPHVSESTNLVLVVFNDNVLMCVKKMLLVITVLVRMLLTNKTYNIDKMRH